MVDRRVSSVKLTSTPVMRRGWQSGIRSGVPLGGEDAGGARDAVHVPLGELAGARGGRAWPASSRR
jgi:hypothetical protein